MAGQGISGDHKDESIDSDDYVDGSVDTIHLADNAVTLAKMASGTDGNIISYDASGNPVAIATGNSGQILTSAGAGAQPAFSAPAALGANSIDSDNYVDGSIDPEHLADNAVTLAKMASGTDGNIISYDASGNPVAIATGNDGQVLTSGGAGAQPAFEDAGGGITASSVLDLTTAGNNDSFSFSPSSSAKRITMMISGLSGETGNNFDCQLGDAGGLETSGYQNMHAKLRTSNVVSVDVTDDVGAAEGSHFKFNRQHASGVMNGWAIFNLQNASTNRWNMNLFTFENAPTREVCIGGGSKALSAVLTTITFTAQGSGFDAGTVSFMEE